MDEGITMISKELLSLLINKPADYIGRIHNNTKNLIWRDTDESLRPIGSSIHEINLNTLNELMIKFITDNEYELDIVCDGQFSIEVIGYCEGNNEFGCLKLSTKSYSELFEPLKQCAELVAREKNKLE